MDAVNRPVGRPRRERHTSDTSLGQPGNLVMPDEGLPDRDNVVIADATALNNSYAEELKFMEEPVTILINKSPEKFAPLTVDCWVNGEGAEVMTDKGWVKFGWLPVERPVTTKRKYVEVLARTKHMSVRTEVTQRSDGESNDILRSNSLKAQFSVLHDPSPKGSFWLQRILAERF